MSFHIKFVLRGIKVDAITNQYMEGGCDDIKIPRIRVKREAWAAPDVMKLNSPSYMETLTTKGGTVREIIMAGTNDKCPCLWCRKRFTHAAIGIPIGMQVRGKTISYMVTGRYCCYQCCLAALYRLELLRSGHRDHVYNNSRCYLESMFNRQYPGKILHRAKEWTLHEINGGPLSDKDFFDDNYIFLPCGSENAQVKIALTVKEYIKMQS